MVSELVATLPPTPVLEGADNSSDRLRGLGLRPDHRELTVTQLCEQHAIVDGTGPIDLAVGARVRVIPTHPRAVADLYPRLYPCGRDGFEPP